MAAVPSGDPSSMIRMKYLSSPKIARIMFSMFSFHYMGIITMLSDVCI